MSENTESSILMKCEHCGYKEKVPVWILEVLYDFHMIIHIKYVIQNVITPCTELMISFFHNAF